MASVIIPVLLSFLLGPGMGQIYNHEYKKAAILIGVSLASLVWPAIWYAQAFIAAVPPDIEGMDPQAMQKLIQNTQDQVHTLGGTKLWLCMGLLMALWVYGMVDAYQGAKRRKRSQQPEGLRN